MDTPSKRRTIIAIAVVGFVLLFGVLQSGLLILLGNALPIEGDVVAVSPGAPGEREATIQLNWGPIVRASIPAACLVFPGQVATVNFVGPLVGAQPSFRVWESKEKQ